MKFQLDDTIAALASAAGSAARGIIRLSGPDSTRIVQTLIDGNTPFLRRTPIRRAVRLRLRGFHTPVAAAICLWPTVRSYTGQPAAEVHLPGSPPLLEAALGDLYANGARAAQPGEFTLRAFLAGRIDLVQAEAVLGVIDARDQPRLKTALSQLAGGVSGRIVAVQHDLLNLLADLEAGLDFVEEEIEFVSRVELLSRIDHARTAIARLLERASSRMLSTGRRRVVLAGLPNAGKSTLFNALVGWEAALVSGSRGTTRDYLAAECDWNGMAIELIDTAGWEGGLEGISGEAQQRRMRQLEQAELVLWCTAADLDEADCTNDLRLRQELSNCDATHSRLSSCDATHRRLSSCDATHRSGLLVVQTKCDVIDPSAMLCIAAGREGVIPVSALDGSGLRELKTSLVSELSGESTEGQELVGTTAARCRESLGGTLAALDRAHAGAAAGAGEEIVAIDLHDALEHLGRILGSVYTDDILDRIFSRFCIGK